MLSPLFDPALADKIAEAGIVAVLVIDDAGDAVPLALSSACHSPAARCAALMLVVPLFFSRRLPSTGSM